MPAPQFPPETFPLAHEAADYDRAAYHYGSSRRPPSDFGTQLREWIDVLVRGKWLVLGALLAVAIPIAAYAVLAPSVYQASTKLYVETESGGPLEGVLPASGGQGAFGQDRGLSNELYILQNAEDLSQTVAQELLSMSQAGEVEGLTVLETETSELPSQDVIADRVAYDYIRVRQDGQNVNGVEVSATSLVPEEAALIADLYAEAYVSRTQNSSRASVTASREFLESQADSVAAELASREEAARDYMNREGAVQLEEESSNLVSQLASLEAARDQARVEAGMEASRVVELRAQIAQLESNVATRLGSGTDRVLRQDEERLATLRSQLETFYARNPSLRSSQTVPSEIASLRREIETLENRIRTSSDRLVDESIAAGGVDAAAEGLPRLAALRDQLTAAEISLRGLRSRIGILDGRIGSRQGELSQIPEQSVELARLVRERQSAERLALGLDQRLQEARVAESAELGYAEVVRQADVPSRPVSPNRPRTIILGLLIGLGLGVALAIGRAQLDQAIRRPTQLKELGHPVLGVVPDVSDLIAEEFDGAETIEVDGRTYDTRLVSLLNPMSTAAEAFRGLRTSIQFSRPDAPIETILVTSASPSEGKSTVAANLAIVMAQSGRRTLLIDADLRRPRVDKEFGMAKSPGLTDFLSNNGMERDIMVADDLDVLPAGSSVPNPAEHLGSKSLRDLLAVFRDAYDLVVIDAPPVMAATDPVLLSTQVDATVVVCAAGKTKDFELQHAVEEIQGVGGQVIGVVLNRFDVSKEYGYRYQYAYRYGNKYAYGHKDAA